MKKWPLRWKVALYSALLAVAATIGGAATTWTLLRYAEIAAFDRRLTTDAHEFFRDVENFAGGPANNRRDFRRNLCPAGDARQARGSHRCQRHAALSFPQIAHVRFRSMESRSFITTLFDGHTIRMAEFEEGGLTLRVGDDLKAINQVGRDIFMAMLGAIPTVLLIILIGSRWVASRAITPIEEIRQAAAKYHAATT